jgi:hypothetical protein
MQFQLIYDGPALVDNEFEVQKLTSALLAMDSLLKRADEVINKGKTSLRVSVKASFKTGSFQIDLSTIQSILDQAKGLFLSDPTNAVLNATGLITILFGSFRGLVRLIKFLAGQKPQQIIENPDGSFRVFKGAAFEDFERAAIDLYRDYRIRQSMDALIAEQLAKEGVDSFAVVTMEKQILTDVRKPEAEYFRCPPFPDQTLDTTEFVTNLHLIKISFKEGNKWRVFDGNAEFNATVEDETFLKGIESSSIQFSKGDILRVRMRQTQCSTVVGLTSENVIVEVLEHKKPSTQLRLEI